MLGTARGNNLGIHAGPAQAAEQARMFDLDATVHHHVQAGAGEQRRVERGAVAAFARQTVEEEGECVPRELLIREMSEVTDDDAPRVAAAWIRRAEGRSDAGRQAP